MKLPRYDDKQVDQLYEGHVEVRHEVSQESTHLVGEFAATLTSESAREFILHGVCRRLSVLSRCVENVFRIYPPERAELLERDERLDLQISLHAFVSNLIGALDNFAWAYVKEHSLESELPRTAVGLFDKRTQKHLPDSLRRHLNTPHILSWHREYAKNYRDALAHRIPLYVAPSVLTPADEAEYRAIEEAISQAYGDGNYVKAGQLQDAQAKLGTICECFVHSFSDKDAKPMRFHAQVLADSRTLVEISSEFRHAVPPAV